MTYGVIGPRFMNLNYNFINKFDTTLELKDVHTKGNIFLSSRPTNFINYDLTNAKCNENYIITNCNFILIPQECIIHDSLSCFIYMMNYNNCCFGVNLINCYAWAYMVGTIGVTKSSNFDKLKFAKSWTNLKLLTLCWTHPEHLHFIPPIVQCLVLTHCIKQLQYVNTCKQKNNLILNTHPLKHLFVIIWWKAIRITHVQIGIIAKRTMKYKKKP